MKTLKFKLWIHGNFKRVYLNDENFNKNWVKVYFELENPEKMKLQHKITGFPDARNEFHDIGSIRNYLINNYNPENFTEILNLLNKPL